MIGPLLIMGATGVGETAPATVGEWVVANPGKVTAYYPMDDAAASGTMADNAGTKNGNYGSAILASTISGVAACDFNDSADGTATVTYDSAWFSQIRGIFVVLEPDDTAVFQQIASRDGANRVYQWRINTDDSVSYLHIDGSVVDVKGGTVGTLPVTVGFWWDGAITHLYVDGVEVASAATGDPGTLVATDLQIGYRRDGSNNPIDFYDGRMCEMVILNSSASTDSVPELHDAWIVQST